MLEEEQVQEQVSCSFWLYLHTCSHILDLRNYRSCILGMKSSTSHLLPEKQPSSSAGRAAVLPRAGGHAVHLLEGAEEGPVGGALCVYCWRTETWKNKTHKSK